MRRAAELIVMLAAVCGASAALADPVRAPGMGEPALYMNTPPDWRVSSGGWFHDHFVLAVMPDREGLVGIAVLHFGGTAPSLREEAQKVATAEWQLDPDSKPASIDGHEAEEFTATERSAPTHVDRKARYIIARLDDHHMAVVIAIEAVNESDADRQATDEAVASVHVVTTPPK